MARAPKEPRKRCALRRKPASTCASPVPGHGFALPGMTNGEVLCGSAPHLRHHPARTALSGGVLIAAPPPRVLPHGAPAPIRDRRAEGIWRALRRNPASAARSEGNPQAPVPLRPRISGFACVRGDERRGLARERAPPPASSRPHCALRRRADRSPSPRVPPGRRASADPGPESRGHMARTPKETRKRGASPVPGHGFALPGVTNGEVWRGRLAR